MRKKILGSLTSLLIPFAAYGAHSSYGAYQRRQSTVIADYQPLSLNDLNNAPAKQQHDVSEAGLAISAGSPVRELVIIDAAVPDKAVLQSAVRPGIETIVLKAGEDALEQTAALLKNYQNLDAVHLVSHGEAGAILLGDRRIDKTTLETQPQFLEALGQATRTGADLLLYACDLASEDAELLEVIQQNSHLDVAASNNLTGAAELGGDWTLEIQAGNIEAAHAFSRKALQDFSAVLRPFGTKTFESWNGEYYSDDPSRDWDGFTTYISTPGTYQELISGITCVDDLYVSMYEPTSQFLIRSIPGGEIFGVTGLSIRAPNMGGNPATQVSIFGYEDGNPTPIASKSNVAVATTATAIDLTTGITGSFADIVRFRIQPNNDDFCLMSVTFTALDTDGSLAAAGGVTEPVGLATTVDTVGEAVNVFDFTLSDGGTSDNQPLTVSQAVVHVSGTSTDAERGQITWRLNGPDVSNVTGTYNAGADTITFSGLTVSIADGGNETYTINAYYNNTSNLTEDRTIILSVDGDTDLTVGAGGTQMGTTTAVNNGTGTTIDVVATALAFTTQPAGSVSGIALTTQPVVTARDAFGNTDVDFTETITLTEASAGSLSNNTQAATNGVATFTNLIYTATADQQSFTLTANDQDGVGSNLPTVDANAVTSDVVATKLIFTTQPAPTTLNSGVPTGFTTVPVVSAVNAGDIVDTGYATGIVLSVTDPNDGTVDGTVNSLTGTGDTDGAGVTVTLTPSSGAATYTGLQLTYTAGGAADTIALRSTSGGLTAANSSNITSVATPVVTDGNISISGASGTGGAYKIGDTVTATWNNTAGGDNNAGITGVTVDFSQFGGGAAVVATNSSSTWTATYTIVSGAIDATNRNVSVTATNADGDSTTADTSNATVDSIAPTVTNANISISGASGTGGAFKIGDTVTATWNNTAGGDNNSDTISAVTVDFSQFGGGAAVAATNSAGTWTSTYTIAAGAIDAANRNVSVTATDNAGNSTTTAGTSNATLDSVAPTVSNANISISGATGAGGAYRIGDTVTATWNNTAGGDDNSDTISGVTADFSQFGGGAAVVASNSSGTWTATYTITIGAIDAANRNVSVTATDNAGNATTTADTSNATVDNVLPTVSDAHISISGGTGTGGAYIIGDTVTATWNNTAGGDNNSDTLNAVTVNFSQFGGGVFVAASNSSDTWTATYTIVAGAISATNRNVAVTARDNANNSRITSDTTNATVDSGAPTVSSVSVPANGTYVAGQNLDFTVNANENVTVDTGGGTPQIALTVGAATRQATYLSGSGTSAVVFRYTVQAGDSDTDGIAVAGVIDANGGTLRDGAGNDFNTTLNSVGSTASVLVDAVAPTVTDANISISGASGTGGAYKIGDTVTATWNNTGGGDNNSDIASVTVNFTAFGGGAAVVATNSAGTWTATYTIVSGAVDATNRNVSVTATDNAGNGTTTADTTNATVDNVAPTVTDANISISGATGTGGAYKIGDTVTATWNNTAGGDNNSDTISSVTIDFSAFGGGAAVAATNSSGTWTAMYTITSGAIDGTNRNVSVTATDNAGNSTTTADTSNATVDNIAPTVTDANISISGASGTGGAYKIGDTVTATWNNTAGGNNNSDTIGSVTVDFSAFGGGAAVAATNSSGTWTATYTITSGAIDGTNRNVSVTATDNAGNATTAADTTNATLDNIAPTVTDARISISGASGTGGAYVVGNTVTATWNNTAGGDNNSDTISSVTVDFSAFGGGAAVAASNSSGTWTATYTLVGGAIDNTNLNVSVTATDNAGNSTTTADSTNATVDNDVPAVTSVTLPANGSYLVGENLDFTVNYDDSVTVNTAGGTPRLLLTIGASTRFAVYQSGSGTAALLFRYTVQSGDSDADGIALNSTLSTNSGTIRDAVDNDADTDLGANDLSGVLIDAVDTDGDGVPDIQEGIDGTDPNDPEDYLDVTAPVITAPADILVDATGLYTTVTLRQLLSLAANATDAEVQQAQDVLATDNIDGDDCCGTTAITVASNGDAAQAISGDLRLVPGSHVVTWQGTDRKDNDGTDTQTVQIRPLVSISKDQVGVEGSPVTFKVLLNGPAIAYPYDVPYFIDLSSTADGGDHNLVDGDATFNAGETEVSVAVNLVDDGLGDSGETIIINLDDTAVNVGANMQHTITITEDNVAPNVALDMQQGGSTVLVVTGNGNVTVTANHGDLNAGDAHTYDWSNTSAQLMDTDLVDSTFTFDPSGLAEGVYNMHVFVSDNNGATDTSELSFRVVTAAPVLGAVDTDGDGINDDVEGFGDDDGDGVPDYLDNITAGNVLPERASVTDAYLMESDPGTRIRLGSIALSGGDGARLAANDLPEDEDFNNVGGLFDFEVHDLPLAGQNVRVVIPQIGAIPEEAVYRKFDGDQWFTFVEDANNALHSTAGEAGFCPPPGDTSWEPGLTAGYFCVQLTVEDGGPNDADRLANGSVEDPGGIAAPVAAPPPPPPPGITITIHGKTQGGGGAIDLPAGLALLLLALLRNRRRAAWLCAIVAVLFTPLSKAQNNETSTAADPPAMEDTGAPESWWQRFEGKSYLAVGLYQAEGDQKRGDFVSGMAGDGVTVAVQEYDVSRSAYQLSLGYRYHPNMAVEFGYLDLGDVNFELSANAANAATVSDALSKHLPISSDGWVLANRFDYVFAGKWRAAAEVGVYFWDGKATIDNAAISARIKDGTDPLFGLGLAYPLPAGLELALQYRRILFDDQDVALWGGGLSWQF